MCTSLQVFINRMLPLSSLLMVSFVSLRISFSPTLNGFAHCHSEGVAERGLKNPLTHAAPWILRCTQNDNVGNSYPTASWYARPLPTPRSPFLAPVRSP